MKRLFFLAVAATFTLASCSSDKEVDNTPTMSDKEIGFRTFIDKGAPSRATVTDQSNILGFTVTAWWDKIGTPDYGNIGPTTGEFLFNAYDITRGEQGAPEWDYDPKLYWPNKGHGVYFFAYSPASSKNIMTGLRDYNGSELEYMVPDPDVYVSQEDFLLARTGMLDKGSVDLQFVHALSRVKFFARNEKPEVNYLIGRVELVNIKKTGRIDLEKIPVDGNLNHPNPQPIVYWDTTNDSADKTLTADLGDSPIYVRSDDYRSILGATNALMVMPQETILTTDPDENTTEFVVRVYYKAFIDVNDAGTYYAGTPGEDISTYKVAYFAVEDAERPGNPHTFEIGRQYNFCLTFGSEIGEKIGFEVKTGNWDDTAPQVELPQITDYYKAGLISAELAKAIKADPDNDGVTLGDILSVNRIFIKDVAGADVLKGIEYFANLYGLYLNNATGLVLDMANLNISNIEVGTNVSFAEMDISTLNVTKKLSIRVNVKQITDYYGSTTGTAVDNTLVIDKLKVWADFKEKTSGITIFSFYGINQDSHEGKTKLTEIIGSNHLNTLPATVSKNFN